ncbi:unnamed protein product (macronuclear) [Paramecium tetraurelia]|uniref:Uncharacterized protein n=1 Tax=Paramecium tetraurelia TaxID=5888 RepID=A0BL47_PARTE|nr:uncharacterized protein GSPATT00029895001 [Paramecium tetraurelia]CAK59264.1 unnamed protein product [Paramecium tetraurelia]|eukprot:XP_001426662.1 hypothetical protein (macronuclear) [Paramecium tetraurelia strain d4-2]
MARYLILLGLLNLVHLSEICKTLQVSTNLKKAQDDIISLGVTSKQWSRKAKNPIIVPASQHVDYIYITSDNPNLAIENFQLNFDDHYYADSSIRLDHRPNGKHTEYAIEINYKCKEYGGTLINYEMQFQVPSCGDAQIFWKKFCGNPLTLREGFSVDMVYKNYRQEIIKNSEIINASYFDSDLDNYVFNVSRDINVIKFILQMKTEVSSTDQIPEEFVTDVATLKKIPEVNLTQPYVDVEMENVTKSWFEGELSNGGLITNKESELTLNFKCVGLGTSKIEITFPFQYFKDITLVIVKDCNYAFKVQNVINAKYQEGDTKTFAVYFVIFIVVFGLIINLCIGRKKGLANIPFFTTLISLLLCITCQQKTCVGRSIRKCFGLTGESFLPSEEPDETFSSGQKQFYGSI